MEIPREINLHNLDEATAQEVFDWSVYNVLKQGKASVSKEGHCIYRGEGTKCAAGFLIPNDLYQESMDRMTDTSWMRITEIFDWPRKHMDLIIHLQATHDSCMDSKFFKTGFYNRAREVSLLYGLKFDHVSQWLQQSSPKNG